MTYLYQHIGAPVFMGRGAVHCVGEKIKEFGCGKVLVVHDKNLKELGLLDLVINSLMKAAVNFVCFDGVLPDPPDVTVEAAAEFAREEQIDGIVAIGGGSALDTAKAVNVLLGNPPPIQQYFVPRNINPGVPLILIPTTAGTGSEVTSIAVVTNTKVDNEKRAINHPVCLARLAIIDPDLTVGMPPALTASTGMDAFAHAAEALTCNLANPLIDALCRESIRMISQNLAAAVQDGKNLKARENMAYASLLAGIAFTNVRVHIGHAIGHVLGAAYHIPHGVACALAITPVIRWAGELVPHQVRMMGEAMGCTIPADATAEEIGNLTANAIQQLKRAIGIPTMETLGLSPDVVEKLVPLVKEQGAFQARPGEISDERLTALLREAYGQ